MSLVIEESYLPATLTATAMSDDAFAEFCAQFPDYFVETSAEGEITIMPPSDFFTSARIGKIIRQLSNWSEEGEKGWVTESSGGFVLPNGARRAPDAAWFPLHRPGAMDARMRPRFAHFVPDFVIELRSPDDRLSRLRAKMEEWVTNGVALGWLIDPERRMVEIYRPGTEPELRHAPESISGEGPVEGFTLDLKAVWNPGR